MFLNISKTKNKSQLIIYSLNRILLINLYLNFKKTSHYGQRRTRHEKVWILPRICNLDFSAYRYSLLYWKQTVLKTNIVKRHIWTESEWNATSQQRQLDTEQVSIHLLNDASKHRFIIEFKLFIRNWPKLSVFELIFQKRALGLFCK